MGGFQKFFGGRHDQDPLDQLNLADDDDQEFLLLASAAIRGMLKISSPEHYAIFKTDNWFDDKWITRRDEIIRFPRERIVQKIQDGKVVDIEDLVPHRASHFYVSGHTSINRRGSLMGRFVAEEGDWLWYVGLKGDLSWQAIRHKNISRTVFSEYVKAGN